MQKLLHLLLLWTLTSVALFGENLFPYGTFEQVTPGNLPDGWSVGGTAKAIWTVIGEGVASGQCLEVNNMTARAPQVFSLCASNVKLTPGEKYRVSCEAKGDEAEAFMLVLGKSWKRYLLENLTQQWRHYEFEYTAQTDEGYDGNYPIFFLCDGLAKHVCVDNLAVEPFVQGKAITVDEFQANRVYPVYRMNGDWRQVDRIPEHLPVFTMPMDGGHFSSGEMPAASDICGRIAWAWCEDGWLFFLDVADQTICVSEGESAWSKDSVQFCLDLPGTRDAYKAIELTVAPNPDNPEAPTTFLQWEGRKATPGEMEIIQKQRSDGYFLAGIIHTPEVPRQATFNAIVNDDDNDGQGRRIAWLQPGIHIEKSPKFNTVLLAVDDVRHCLFAEGETDEKAEFFCGMAVIANLEASDTLAISLKDEDGKVSEMTIGPLPDTTADRPLALVPFQVPLASLKEGTISGEISLSGKASVNVSFRKSDLLADGLATLEKLDGEILGIRHRLAKLPQGIRELTVPEALIRRWTAYAREAFAKAQNLPVGRERDFYLDQGSSQAVELQEIMQVLKERLVSAEVGQLPICPEDKYIDPPIRNGYGHFGAVAHNWPELAEINCKVTQVEIGPWQTLPFGGDSKNPEALDAHILPALRNAKENGAKVILLLSPHYMPQWARDQVDDKELDWIHPGPVEATRRHIHYVLETIRENGLEDAIHSFCLTNECVYAACRLERPFTQKLFLEYLAAKFQTVQQMNLRCGSSFADFQDVIDCGMDNPVTKVEFHRFRTETLARFHSIMVDAIHDVFPDAMASAKFMAPYSNRISYLEHGVDFEAQAWVGDFNGCDNFNTCWNMDWKTAVCNTDRMRSFRDVPVLNMEDHIIVDGERRKIPYNHIYQAEFQQFLAGSSQLVTWVYEPCNFSHLGGVIAGNIFHRPMDLLAHSDALADALRLYPQVEAFVSSKPAIRILCSQTSYALSEDVNPADYELELHNIVTTSGRKCGFVSEKQAAAGELLDDCRLLILPAVNYLPAETLRALKGFKGIIYSVGECCAYDEYGNRAQGEQLGTPLPMTSLGSIDEEAFRGLLDKQLPVPISVEVTKGPNIPTQLFWQCVPYGNGHLVNFINYGDDECTVQFTLPEGMAATDMLTGKTLEDGIAKLQFRRMLFLSIVPSSP